ncbi:MAG TPA: polysaccharide deacetylase family protein [Myxococcaceae bacterium]|nr:polysaccharide deacetylase family protein [Myxococcaceae bacterium]
MDAELARLVRQARHVTRMDLRSRVSLGVKACSHRSGLLAKLSQLQRAGPAIIFYHKVYQRPVGRWGEPVIGVEELERQVAFLSREYQPVRLSEIAAALRHGLPLPERAVALTFDDGYRNNLQLAAPIFRRHGVPATLFVITGVVGTEQWMWGYELEKMFSQLPLASIGLQAGDSTVARICAMGLAPRVALMACCGYLKSVPHARQMEVMARLRERFPVELDDDHRFLSWDEVRALRGYGFELGAHTVSHPILVHQPLDEAEWEISASARQLEQALGERPTMFSYPNGDASPEVVSLVGKYFETAVTTRPGLCSPFTSVLELPRLPAPCTVAELDFELTRWRLRHKERP